MTNIRLGLLALLLLSFSRLAVAATPDPKSDEFWYGRSADGAPVVHLYYFFSPACPHCQAARPLVEDLAARKPWLELRKFAVKDNPDNARFYYQTAQSLGVEALSIPGFVFCRQVMIGYDSAATTGADLEKALDACHAERVAHPGASAAEPTSAAYNARVSRTELTGGPAITTFHLPFVGTVDTQALSLPVLTLVLAGMDAFNPCAFFVLLFLLSLLVHAKSRTRMAIVGGTFVLFSGIVYFVFMAAWLNVFLVAGELRLITVVAGLLALTVAALNIKDYFWFKEGPSLSIPDAAKPGLFRRMRDVVNTGSMGPMLASTVLLAIVANSYELLCTAGFPMVYTRALTLAKLESWQYYAWLAAYNVIYVLPLLAIVVVFTRTMGARKLTESEGRILKLVSGFMMLGFGIVLLFAPNLLTNALASILVLAVAVGASILMARFTTPRTA
ncbi:MAG: thioredoxin family protein [Gammaproteobacteria bacterium]|nr:thioredoxin family protein [Gammaproteobacteria bacterium]